jgi:hypothetical protein
MDEVGNEVSDEDHRTEPTEGDGSEMLAEDGPEVWATGDHILGGHCDVDDCKQEAKDFEEGADDGQRDVDVHRMRVE